jgi:hypothetical protein
MLWENDATSQPAGLPAGWGWKKGKGDMKMQNACKRSAGRVQTGLELRSGLTAGCSCSDASVPDLFYCSEKPGEQPYALNEEGKQAFLSTCELDPSEVIPSNAALADPEMIFWP